MHYDLSFSVFDKWLTADESDTFILSIHDVKSLNNYLQLQKIELNYLKLFTNLKDLFQLQYVDMGTLKLIDNLQFNFLFREISNHILKDQEKLFLIPKEQVFIMLSFDFNIYLYFIGDLECKLKDIFEKNEFHILPLNS
ncbi:hypothetical protein D3C71_52840 [compost metagenome]